MNLPNGTLLQGGKYRIVCHVSSGGFGKTYEAVHTMMDTKVAIKEFFPKMFCNRDENTSHITVLAQSNRELVDKLRKKFIEEAQAIFKMNHANIVKVHDIFEENGTAYYVMDYIEGQSLSEIIKECGSLPESVAVGYIRQVADALRYVHSLNRLHLDIKPGNIMIDATGHAILIDFGASKYYDMENDENTSTLIGVNTKGYAPVEQSTQSFSKFSPATDIYALGATLYKLLTGITPPDANLLMTKEEILTPMPSSISIPIRNAVLRAMALIRADRPQTVEAFLSFLDSKIADNSYGEDTLCENEDVKRHAEEARRRTEEQKHRDKELQKSANERRNSEEQERNKEEEDEKRKAAEKKNEKSGKWVLWGCMAAMALIAVVMIGLVNKGNTSSLNSYTSIEVNSNTLNDDNSSISIDKNRVESLISCICLNSSKGSDFNVLKNYFTDEIYPHPSGEKRYNHNVGEKLEAYVNRFPLYKVSKPYNLSYVNTSFPLIVKCDVIVDWINTKGASKQAIVHKTFYITSEYKVSGFTEIQENVH